MDRPDFLAGQRSHTLIPDHHAGVVTAHSTIGSNPKRPVTNFQQCTYAPICQPFRRMEIPERARLPSTQPTISSDPDTAVPALAECPDKIIYQPLFHRVSCDVAGCDSSHTFAIRTYPDCTTEITEERP